MSDAARRPDGIRIRPAGHCEAEIVAAVVRASFQTVADDIGMDIPPVHETAGEVGVTLDRGDVTLVAEAVDGTPVGTVRGETMGNGSVMVRRLAVLPEYRGRGIARALMLALEDAYPDIRRFELFTGAMAEVPIALYESLGYTHMSAPADAVEWLVYLEKCR